MWTDRKCVTFTYLLVHLPPPKFSFFCWLEMHWNSIVRWIKKKKRFFKGTNGTVGQHHLTPSFGIHSGAHLAGPARPSSTTSQRLIRQRWYISFIYLSFFFSLKELNLFQREYRTSCMPVQFFFPPSSSYHLLTCVNRRRGGGVGREFSCYCGRPCQLNNLL